MKHKNKPNNVGRGHVPADRAAADGTSEQACTQPVVPARDCHVAALLAMTQQATLICHCEIGAHTTRRAVRRICNAPSSRTAAHRSWQSPAVGLYSMGSSCTGGDMSPPYICLHYISKNRWDWKLPPISLSFALILNDLRLHAEGFIKDG